jgi:hypothetical protein
VKYEQDQVAGKPVAKGNALDLSLDRVSRLTIDLPRAGLTAKRALKLHVVSDGAAAVVLRRDARHARVVHVAAGTRDVTVAP